MWSAHWYSHGRPATLHTRTVGARTWLTCVLHPSAGRGHASSARNSRGTQGQLLRRTYAQRAGDRMLAPSRLFERTLRTVRLEVVVRISHNSGWIADRYQAATARSAQAAVAPDHLFQVSSKGRNSLCGLLEINTGSPVAFLAHC